VVVRVEDRESCLEELSLSCAPTIQALMLTGGCSRLTTLSLDGCRRLDTVHITDARALTSLQLTDFNIWAHRSRATESLPTDEGPSVELTENEAESAAGGEPCVRIEGASALVEVKIRNVNARFLESLAHLSNNAVDIRIMQRSDYPFAPCMVAFSRMLQSGPALSALHTLQLETTTEIDGFVIDNAAALPNLSTLTLSGQPLRNVTLALPSLRVVHLNDNHGAPKCRVTEDKLIDGRVSVSTAGATGRMRRLALVSLRVRDLHVDFPAIGNLSLLGTYVPPHELERWRTCGARLRMLEYAGMTEEEAQQVSSDAYHDRNRY
jgi:hypothetical protein